jgi:transposase
MASLQKSVSRGHTYWQIVTSRRVNGKPRPVVLLHLGTADALLRRLQGGPGRPVKAKVLEFGAVSALWNLWHELDLTGIIDRQVQKRNQGLSCGQYMLLAALNRCVGATSKACLYDWYRGTALQHLLPTSKRSLESQRFWDHMEYLSPEDIRKVEETLTRKLVEECQVDLSTLLFDATNFDTFIDTQTDCDLAQRGHAKSKRGDLRIVGLALLVSRDFHIPLLSHFYPGNQNDSKMFGDVVDGLIERYRQFSSECQDITVIFDGGNTSNDNMEEISRSSYHFITSLTLTHHKDLLSIPLRKYQSFSDERLDGTTAVRTTKEVWGEQRTIVVTRSENLLAGQIAGIASALKKKRTKLNELRTKLRRSQGSNARGKGYTRDSLEKHLKTITSGQYISDILKAEIVDDKGFLDFYFWTDTDAYRRLKDERLGKRILCTDNEEWTTEEIIIGSRAQSKVEDAFKQMKNPHWVRFSPAFHWTDQKLRVHAFYCVLALTLSSLLAKRAAASGIRMTINALYRELAKIREVINLYPSDDKKARGRCRAEFVLTERSSLQDRLCRAFDLYKLARSKPA